MQKQVLSLLFSTVLCISAYVGASAEPAQIADTVSGDSASSPHDTNGTGKYFDKKIALAIYHPYFTVCCLPDKSIFFSGEAEYSINRYFSVATEMRYWHIPRVTGTQRLSGSIRSFYAIGPGVRIYPEGNGMHGFFLAWYYQLIMGTEKHGLYNPFTRLTTTQWFGYRIEKKSVYLEGAGGILFSDKLSGGICPIVSLGIGIWF